MTQILSNFFLFCLISIALVIKTLTLGRLREAESEVKKKQKQILSTFNLHVKKKQELLNRLWSSIFDALLLATIFSGELSTSFFGLLTILIFSRSFHWVVKSRVDFVCIF